MSVNIIQSDIAEVRDQLSLDFADGKYLNVVTGNLGIPRPPYGFDDDTWRSVVKVLALKEKQVRTKFQEVLSILLGPRVTQCSSFSEPVAAGATSGLLVGTSQFPQIGTMVIDEGLPTEETVRYCYIDRYSNRVYFDTPLAFAHVPVNAEWETGVIGPNDPLDPFRTVFDLSGFPDPAGPSGTYPVVVGRGTPYEFVDLLASLPPPVTGTVPYRAVALTNGSPVFIPGANTSKGEIVRLALTGSPTEQNIHYLTVEDNSPFGSIDDLKPENGYVQIAIDGSFTATAGSTTSVIVASPVLEDYVYTGFVVRFDGNVTSSLTGAVGYVATNFSNNLFFLNILPAAPAAGDTFTISVMLQYIRAIKEDSAILIKDNLPDLLQFQDNARVSILEPTTTITIAQVQVKAGGWDIIESDPDHVEILLPSTLLENDLRSASYVRETGLSGSTTADAARLVGDADISVTSTAGFPLVGVLSHNATTQYAYFSPHGWLTQPALTGDTQITVTDTSLFTALGGLNLNIDGTVVGPYTVINTTTLGVPALAADIERGALVRDENIFRLNKVLLFGISIADTVDWYAFYDSGDIWNGIIDDLWPGPYLWDKFEEIVKKETVGSVVASTVVSGPTVLDVDRVAGNSVFELADASNFPSTVPYDAIFGENSGNVETLSIQELSLKQRTYTTVATAVSVGDTSIDVAALTGPLGPNHTFPNAGPYRVALWSSSTSVEVVEVVGTDTGPDRLNLSFPTTGTHSVGTRVVLLSDLVRVSPAAADDHLGIAKQPDKFKFYPPQSQVNFADTVRPVYTSLTISAVVDFSPSEGNAYFNFGDREQTVKSEIAIPVLAGATVLTLADTSNFPTAVPYTVKLDHGAGPLYEERVVVLNNNTGLSQLTISHATSWDHNVDAKVVYECGPEENFSYTSTSGTNLLFDPRLQVEYTHQISEFVSPTVGTGYPRNNGFDFPFRIPVTAEDRIRFILDLVRAAGVLVTFINKR